jgi:hypothetical protein
MLARLLGKNIFYALQILPKRRIFAPKKRPCTKKDYPY